MEHVISVEELSSRKVDDVVLTEAGGTSRGNEQPINIVADQETQVTKKASLGSWVPHWYFKELETKKAEVCEWEQHWLKRLEKAGDYALELDHGKKPGPKIQRVPFLLRDNKNVAKYFEPRVVSLGPIHYDKPKYQIGEEYKLGLANQFVKESGEGQKAETLYVEIKKKIKQLREYFDEEVNNKYENDEYLAWMMFVDGCAVLQFIKYEDEDKFKYLKIKNDQVVFVREDVFLLENQL